jgi:hypothetical protein
MLNRWKLVLAVALVFGALAAPTAQAGSLKFSNPVQLPHGDPDAHPYYTGGEPSIAFDPAGDGHVYVTAPESIPALLLQPLGIGDATAGIAYWTSDDHGRTWPVSGNTGTLNGGGDSDVIVGSDHAVIAADLEAIDTALCISTDFGRSFPNCEMGVTTNHQGPEDDRQWLTRGPKGEIYLTYHDFGRGLPIILESTDGATTFTPCGTIIDPAGPAAQQYAITQSTRVAKPLVDAAGDVFVQFTTPDAQQPGVIRAFRHVYMAVAKGGCGPTTVFKNYEIYSDPGASLGNLFQVAAIDAGGRLYVLGAGQTKAGQDDTGLYLFTSGDSGATWSKPVKVNPLNLKANMLPAIQGGQGRGEVAIGWVGTETSGDPNNVESEWRVYAAESYDGGQTFNAAAVTPDPMHFGDICNQGTLCGLVPGQPGGNRNLLDFTSMDIDPSNGCVAFAYPGDPYNNGSGNFSSSAYASVQDDAVTCLTTANAGKAAADVGIGEAECLDRASPVSRFDRLAHPASRRTGVAVGGRTSDRGCGQNGAGAIKTVSVALARKSAKRCRFARSDGSFGAATSCAKRAYLRARGTARWRLAFRHRLRAGHYVAYARAVDTAGNVERKPRTLAFAVR